MSIPQVIGLVDFSHGLTVHFKARANDSAPNDAGQAFINDLAGFRDMCGGTVVLCLDKGPYRRTSIFPGYKGGREREPEYAAIYRWTLERCAKDGYQTAVSPGEEGDDVIATLAREYEEAGCNDIRIFGADKDTCQLLSNAVRMFVPKGRGEFEIRDPAWVVQKYGVEPKDMALFQAICGDTSDKIPGIKGIGDKGAAKLITTYGTIEKMAAACANAAEAARLTDKPVPAFWRNYAAGMAELPKWLDLTTLCRFVKLDKPALAYLERLPVQRLVEPSDADDSEFYDTPDEEMPDPDWEAVAAATAERERAELSELAAALPVESQRSAADRQVAAARAMNEPAVGMTVPGMQGSVTFAARAEPLIGKAPNADQVLADAAAEREAEKLARLKAEAHERIASGQTDPATGKVEGFTPPGAKKPTPKDIAAASPAPAATPAPSGAASAAAAGASPLQAGASAAATAQQATVPATAEVVPRTQGPQVGERLAVVPVPPPSWALATQPRSPTEMAQCAARFHNSRYYAAHGNVDGTFAVIALGRELGLGMAAAIEGFHIVQGRPFPKAVMLKALAEKHPDCEWIMITSADDKHATIKTKHRKFPDILDYTYDIERARKAGYLDGQNKHNWLTKPQEMLEARATSKAVRRWYPGATFGMHSVEEAVDD